jgi:hypothetical protein
MVNTISSIEDAAIGFRAATQNLKQAYGNKDRIAFSEAAFETAAATSFISYYLLSIPRYLNNLLSTIANSQISKFFTFIPYLQAIGALGVAGYGSIFIKEMIAAGRQFFFFKTDLWKSIKNKDPQPDFWKGKNVILLKRVLPDWLNKELNEKDTVRQNLDMTIKSYVLKKGILHSIGMATAAAGIVASVGLIVSFSSLVLLALTAVLLVLLVVAYLYKNGVVENPNDGFSIIRCLPAAMVSNAMLEREERRIQQSKTIELKSVEA